MWRELAYNFCFHTPNPGSLDCLRPLGMMVSFGQSSGPVEPLPLGQLAASVMTPPPGDWPTAGYVTREFIEGQVARGQRPHPGLDIAGPEGASILAAGDGVPTVAAPRTLIVAERGAEVSVVEHYAGRGGDTLTVPVTELHLEANAGLTSLAGLKSLSTVGGDLVLRDNDVLRDLQGAAGLPGLSGRDRRRRIPQVRAPRRRDRPERSPLCGERISLPNSGIRCSDRMPSSGCRSVHHLCRRPRCTAQR